MRKAGLLIITAGLALTPAAAASELLTLPEARTAAKQAAVQSFAGFTEKKPRTKTRCRRVDTRRARCRVSYQGDRLRASVKAVVREDSDGYYVRLYQLKVR